MGLTTDTFDRPDDLGDDHDPNVLYARSYLLIRLVVGGIGILLPTFLFLLDGLVLRGGVLVRGSLSAYYHSGARDLFVASLCVTGFMLLTYMAGQRSTWDNRLSSVAGIAVLGVAFLPTKRSAAVASETLCGPGSMPVPPGCTQIQQLLGETLAATIHFICAGIFILSLAALCFVFAHREKVHGGSKARVRFHRVCGTVILGAVAWVGLGGLLGLEILAFTPLYVGEVVSVYAFGASWIVKGRDLLRNVPLLKSVFFPNRSVLNGGGP